MTPKEKARAARLHKVYGITPQQWDIMYARQLGLCKICYRPIYKYGNKEGKRADNVDHDHKPPHRVRCLCCHVCNRERIGMNTVATAHRVALLLESTFDGRNL